MKRNFWLGLGGIVVIGLILVIGVIVVTSLNKAEAREHRIVIPEGTGALIKEGKNPQVIPSEIHLKVGDTLVIENRDIVGHEISDLWIGAGETLRQEFRTVGVYKGACTVHPNAEVQIIVDES